MIKISASCCNTRILQDSIIVHVKFKVLESGASTCYKFDRLEHISISPSLVLAASSKKAAVCSTNMHSSVVWCVGLLIAVTSAMSLSAESSAESENVELTPTTHTSHENNTQHATYRACLHEVCYSIVIVFAL